MQNEFEHTLQRANVVQAVAIDNVKQALNHPQAPPFPGALQTPELFDHLRSVMAASPVIVEVAVVNPDGEILADSLPDSQGKSCPRYPDLAHLVNRQGWFDKLRVLLGRRSEAGFLAEVTRDWAHLFPGPWRPANDRAGPASRSHG